MDKASTSKSLANPIRPQKGKRTVISKYTRHACAQCKKARTKCSGGKPICERCEKTGHDCVWTLEDARRPLTRAHEQALKQQNALLRAEVENLKKELSTLKFEITDSRIWLEGQTPGTSQIYSNTSNPSVGDKASPASPQIAILKPTADDDEDCENANTEGVSIDVDEMSDGTMEETRGIETDTESAFGSGEDSEDSDLDVDKALIVPTKTLFSEHDDHYHYGPTSVFRLRRRISEHSLRHRQREGVQDMTSDCDSSSSDQERIRPSRRAPQAVYPTSSISPESMGQSISPSNRFKRDRKGRGKIGIQSAYHCVVSSILPQGRHTLLVGDVSDETWKGCDCRSECWNRWLPKGIPLSRKEHDILLDRLFFFFTCWGMRVIPEFFLRDMHTFLHPPTISSSVAYSQVRTTTASSPKLAHYSPFLHNSLLAVASAFSDDPEIRKTEVRERFVNEAKSYLEDECSRPNISTVQALGVLASYYSGRGQQTLGFMYFGISTRMGQALGLSADCTSLFRSGRIHPQQVLDRVWAFHMITAQDACWSLYVGRECAISLPVVAAGKHDEDRYRASLGFGPRREVEKKESLDDGNETDVKTRMESAVNATALENPFSLRAIAEGNAGKRLDFMTWKMKGGRNDNLGVNAPQCRSFTTFQWSCQLMRISRHIMDLMNRLAAADTSTEIKMLVTDIDIQLDVWRQDLPVELRLTPSNELDSLPHKLMMHAAFWWQHILLHRPFYQRHNAKSVDSNFSIARCNVAAREILGILRLYRKIYGSLRFSPITLIQTIFAAGSIYVLQSIHASGGRRPAALMQASALDNIEELIRYLRECAESWDSAARIADTFDKLLKEQRQFAAAGTNQRRASNDAGKPRSEITRRKRRKMVRCTNVADNVKLGLETKVADGAPSGTQEEQVESMILVDNSNSANGDTSKVASFPTATNETSSSAQQSSQFSPISPVDIESFLSASVGEQQFPHIHNIPALASTNTHRSKSKLDTIANQFLPYSSHSGYLSDDYFSDPVITLGNNDRNREVEDIFSLSTGAESDAPLSAAPMEGSPFNFDFDFDFGRGFDFGIRNGSLDEAEIDRILGGNGAMGTVDSSVSGTNMDIVMPGVGMLDPARLSEIGMSMSMGTRMSGGGNSGGPGFGGFAGLGGFGFGGFGGFGGVAQPFLRDPSLFVAQGGIHVDSGLGLRSSGRVGAISSGLGSSSGLRNYHSHSQIHSHSHSHHSYSHQAMKNSVEDVNQSNALLDLLVSLNMPNL